MQAAAVEIQWDYKHFYLNQKPFFPIIQTDGGFNPKKFNGYVITLPCRDENNLFWDHQIAFAEDVLSKGGCLIWELDLQISNTQLVEEFRDRCFSIFEAFQAKIFEKFSASSIGVILYKGQMMNNMADNKQLLANLSDIAAFLPIDIPAIALFDCQKISLSSQVYHYLISRQTAHLLLAVKGMNISIPAFCWEKGEGSLGFIGHDYFKLNTVKETKVGICLPETIVSGEYFLWDNLFTVLKDKKIDFRIISETHLSEEWDNIDYLLIQKTRIHDRTIRQVQGFSSAGGTIVYLDEPFGLSPELSLSEYLPN